MIDLRRLRYFVAVAEELHFGRAALRLGISQPPLSQQIRLLEEELGVRLLHRTQRSVMLTPAGGMFLKEARAVLAQAERAVATARRAGRGEVGELGIGFTASAAFSTVIPALLFRYRRRFPDVRLSLRELSSAEQIAALVGQHLDFGFMRAETRPEGASGLTAVELFRDPLVAVLPAGHRLASETGSLAVAALAREAFIMHPREMGTGIYDQVLGLCRAAGFTPDVAQEARENPTIVGLVAAGLGVAILAGSMRRMAMPGVAYRALAEPGSRSSMWLVWRDAGPSALRDGFLAVAEDVRQKVAG